MVRTLTGALFAALTTTTRIPVVQASIEDHLQHFNLYQSPNDADNINDACVADDGSIIRVRVTRGGGGITSNFQYQRITTPGTAGQWSTWTTFTGGSGNMFQDGGCAVSNNSGTLRAFAQRITGGNALRVWTSTDNGVSWTGPVSVLTPPGNAFMRGAGSAGNDDIFILYDLGGGGVAMGASFFSGAWSALSVWSFPSITFGAGLAPVWDAVGGIYYVVYSDGRAMLELTFDPGAVIWNATQAVAQAEVTSANHLHPRIHFDTTTELYNLVTIEFDNGITTGSAYQYPRVWQSIELLHWSVGKILHTISSLYGASYVGSTGFEAAYIVSMSKILQEPYFSDDNPDKFLDISDEILSYTRTEISSQPSKLEITLDNNAGALISFLGTPISANCSIILREGYKTGSPPTTPETIKVNVFRINQILIQRSPQENQIKIIAYDQSRDLDLVNRFQMAYTTFAVGYLITEICARAGFFNIVLPITSQMDEIVPFFILQSGQPFRRALDELCNVYALEYFFDQDLFLQFREIDGLTLPIWTYQPEVELITFSSDDLRGNHVIVNGKPPGGFLPAITSGEAYDETDAHLTGLERLIIHTDLKLTTAAQCASKAQFILDSEKRAAAKHQATIPLNPALQLLDVVTLTDYAPPQGSGQSDNALLVKIRVSYDATTATYSMKLDAQGV